MIDIPRLSCGMDADVAARHESDIYGVLCTVLHFGQGQLQFALGVAQGHPCAVLLLLPRGVAPASPETCEGVDVLRRLALLVDAKASDESVVLAPQMEFARFAKDAEFDEQFRIQWRLIGKGECALLPRPAAYFVHLPEDGGRFLHVPSCKFAGEFFR